MKFLTVCPLAITRFCLKKSTTEVCDCPYTTTDIDTMEDLKDVYVGTLTDSKYLHPVRLHYTQVSVMFDHRQFVTIK